MTVITFTKPISEFTKSFENGTDIQNKIDLSNCNYFWIKHQEILIYSVRQILYSCCYTEWKNNMYITSIWSKQGCEYEYEINYDEN